jgi:regulator of sigma E protease
MIQSFLHAFTPQGILVFLIIISVLVAAHEYGHYLFAKIFKMGVEEFAIGFGRRPLFTYRRKTYRLPVAAGEAVEPYAESSASGMPGEMSRRMITPVVVDTPEGRYIEETTNFTVRPWPLGGFVRIKGMMPEDDGSEVRIPGGFYSKPPWQRFLVLLAGPVFSVLAGVVMLTALYSTDGYLKYQQLPILGNITVPSPAASAGLKPGDQVVSIDGDKINSFYQMIGHVRDAGGKSLNFVYLRDGKQLSTIVVPQIVKEPSPVRDANLELTSEFRVQAKMGVEPQRHLVRLSPVEALAVALESPGKAVGMIAGLFKQPAMLKNAVGGPLTMLQVTSDAASGGLGDIIEIAALLSISVGIFNSLPVPPLDGGQMAIAIAEMFRRGRRLSMRVQNTVAAAGMALVLTLVVVVFFIDVQRIGAPKEDLFKATPPQAVKGK